MSRLRETAHFANITVMIFKENDMKKILKISIVLTVLILMLLPLTLSLSADGGDVIYVSDKGKDSASGLSPDQPKKSIVEAINALPNGGGTVVLVGKTTINGAASGKFPYKEGKVTVTSSYNGEDYSSQGAVLNVYNDIYLASPTVFENISMTASASPYIYCMGNDTVFGDGIVTKAVGGSNIAIYGGGNAATATSVSACSFYGYTVEINSGSWLYASLGNNREEYDDPCGFIGDCSLIINGGAFTASGTSTTDKNFLSITRHCGLDGDASLIINGGSFNSSIFAVGRCSDNASKNQASYTGNISIEINGGSFKSDRIAAVQEAATARILGDLSVSISGGTFSSLGRISAEKVEGLATIECSDPALYELATDFAGRIYLSNSGNDANDGSKASPKKTLSAAFSAISEHGGDIILLTEIKERDMTLPAANKPVTVKGEGGKLNVEGTLYLSSPVTFESVTLVGNASLINGGGNNITVKETVTTEGYISLDGGKGTASHGVAVYGGDFYRIGGGTATDGNVAVLMAGGSAYEVYGSSLGYTRGKASVIVTGGEIKEKLASAEYSSRLSSAIAIYGGNTSSAAISGAVLDTSLVRFIKDGGEGDGKTPFSPAGSIYMAAEELSKTGGRIVVLGRYSQRNEEYLPSYYGKEIYIGGSASGVDFSPVFGSELMLSANFILGGDTVFEDIKIVSMTNSAYISANGSSVIIEESVKTEKCFDRAVTNYPSLFGGAAITSDEYMGTVAGSIVVNGGNWHYVYGGNYHGTESAVHKIVSGNIYVEINGGKFYGGVAGNGMNNLRGSVSVKINGGIFACSVYGGSEPSIGYGSSCTVTGDVTVDITGGEFRGSINAFARPSETNFNGNYSLSILGGELDRVNSVMGVSDCPTYKKNKCKDSITLSNKINLEAEIEGKASFENPIAYFADPSICMHNGWYYYVYTSYYYGQPCIYMRRAANIADISATTPTLLWSQKEAGTKMTSLWAPSMYSIDGKLYMYATVSYEENVELHRKPEVWIGNGDDPEDGFTYHGIFDNIDTEVSSYLSPRILQYEDRLFLVTGGFWRDEDKIPGKHHHQSVFICELSDPKTFKTKMNLLVTPEYNWEKDGSVWVVEGVCPIYTAPDGKLYCGYAANKTDGNDYCTGLLRFDGSSADELLDRSKWHKFDTPFHSASYEDGIYSPGAMWVTYDENREETWMVYHVKLYLNCRYVNRTLLMQKMEFDGSGAPKFTKPMALDCVGEFNLNSKPLSERMGGFDKLSTADPAPEKEVTPDPTVEVEAPKLAPEGAKASGGCSSALCESFFAAFLLALSLCLVTLRKKKL